MWVEGPPSEMERYCSYNVSSRSVAIRVQGCATAVPVEQPYRGLSHGQWPISSAGFDLAALVNLSKNLFISRKQGLSQCLRVVNYN